MLGKIANGYTTQVLGQRYIKFLFHSGAVLPTALVSCLCFCLVVDYDLTVSNVRTVIIRDKGRAQRNSKQLILTKEVETETVDKDKYVVPRLVVDRASISRLYKFTNTDCILTCDTLKHLLSTPQKMSNINRARVPQPWGEKRATHSYPIIHPHLPLLSLYLKP